MTNQVKRHFLPKITFFGDAVLNTLSHPINRDFIADSHKFPYPYKDHPLSLLRHGAPRPTPLFYPQKTSRNRPESWTDLDIFSSPFSLSPHRSPRPVTPTSSVLTFANPSQFTPVSRKISPLSFAIFWLYATPQNTSFSQYPHDHLPGRKPAQQPRNYRNFTTELQHFHAIATVITTQNQRKTDELSGNYQCKNNAKSLPSGSDYSQFPRF